MYDGFIVKYDSNGELLWSTFLGGGLHDEVRSMALGPNGTLLVTGYSQTTWGVPNRPYTAGDADAFVAKLDVQSGALIWNTFLGGSGSDVGKGLAVDTAGNAYVLGESSKGWWSSPIRPYSGGMDLFVAKVDLGGIPNWVTFLGGSGDQFVGSSLSNPSKAIAVDSRGSLVVAGSSLTSWGTPLRPYSGGWDGFVVKLDANAQIVWSTFLGGAGEDLGNSVAVSGAGSIYVGGEWNSECFVGQLDVDGSLIWTSKFGPGIWHGVEGLAIDREGSIFVTGSSRGPWGTPLRNFSAEVDGFAAKFTSSGELAWSTFLGGSGFDIEEGIALDSRSNVYVAGGSSAAWSAPVHAFSGGYDSVLVKLSGSGASRGRAARPGP